MRTVLRRHAAALPVLERYKGVLATMGARVPTVWMATKARASALGAPDASASRAG